MRSSINYWINKFVSGFKGFYWLLREEKSIWFDLFIAVIVIIMGIIFSITILEWVILMLTMALVISVEMINSAIEGIVDLVMFQYNINAKKVKDIAAAASLFLSAIAVIIGLIIFLPYIITGGSIFVVGAIL